MPSNGDFGVGVVAAFEAATTFGEFVAGALIEAES